MLIASAALIACGGSAPKDEANAVVNETAVEEVVNDVKDAVKAEATEVVEAVEAEVEAGANSIEEAINAEVDAAKAEVKAAAEAVKDAAKERLHLVLMQDRS